MSRTVEAPGEFRATQMESFFQCDTVGTRTHHNRVRCGIRYKFGRRIKIDGYAESAGTVIKARACMLTQTRFTKT
jgi:hypothetical protein